MSESNLTDVMPVGERNHAAKEATLNRACDYCRGLKVRCFPDPGSSASTCQRCARSNRACTYAAPQRRKQRKRTDARVAELEKEMKVMRSLLRLNTVDGNRAMEQAQQTEKNLRYGQDSFPDHTILSQELSDQNTTPNSQVTMDVSPPQIADREERDIVDRGLLTMASATELYNIFINELTPHYPTVTFPSHHTADELRRRRPTLFLAVMAAASGRTDPNLYSVLNAELLQIYASRAVISGEKSLELVQSMIITAVWYYPKDKFDQLKFYQYIHMAATIALDIGLGSKPASSNINCQGPYNSTTVSSGSAKQGSQDISPQSNEEESDDAMVDAKRTILVCYLICSGVAISLRRPNMLRFNSWMKQCTSFLENLPTATVFDRRLVARVRLQNIAEEFASLFSLEDPDDTSITLDSRTQLTLKAFERRLKVWKESQDPEVMNASTLMLYYHINILLHEIALRDDHPATDFKPPYFVNRFRPESRVKEKLTAPTIDAIMQCVTFSHDLLDTFTSLDVSTTRALPVYKFVMVCYSILILTKLSQSVENPSSEIGKILDHSSIALDSYTDRAIAQFAKATGIEEFRVPRKFIFVLNCIRGFRRGQCFHPTQDIADSDVMRPLLHLTLEEPVNSHAHCRTLDARSPAFGSGGYARKSNGPIPPNMYISSHDDATTTYTQTHSVDQNNNSTPNNSEYTFQYAQEQSPAQLTSKSTQVPAPGISYELNMGPSAFSGLPEGESFTEELYNWIPPASVTGHTVDEQMLDFQYWGYDSHPQT